MPDDPEPPRAADTSGDADRGSAPAQQARPGALHDLAGVLSLLVLSTAVAILALATARGVVPFGDDRYATEFISGWWWLAFLLAPAPSAWARRRPAAAAAAVAALVVPQFVAAAVCVARYRASGWDDGLEALSFLIPLLLTVVTGALVVALSRRARAPRQAPT